MKTRLLFAMVTLLLSSRLSAAPIKFGASVQLTGPVANTGRYYRDAYQLAIEKINAAGGVKIGGQSRKLSLKLYDNQSDVNLSVRQYTQLVSQDKVHLLLGPFASNFALADSAVSEKYKVPMVQGGGASDQIFSRGFKYIFGTLAPASNYFGSTVDMLKQLKPAPKRWHCCMPTTPSTFPWLMARGRCSSKAASMLSWMSVTAPTPPISIRCCRRSRA